MRSFDVLFLCINEVYSVVLSPFKRRTKQTVITFLKIFQAITAFSPNTNLKHVQSY